MGFDMLIVVPNQKYVFYQWELRKKSKKFWVVAHSHFISLEIFEAFAFFLSFYYLHGSIKVVVGSSPVALQLRPPPKVSARAPAHRSYHFRGVKLKSCIKKIHHNLYISKQANVRIKHADTEGASHKKFGTDARVQ